MLVTSQEELVSIYKLIVASKKIDLIFNASKTKIVIINRVEQHRILTISDFSRYVCCGYI